MDCVSSRVTSIARFVKLVSETSNFLAWLLPYYFTTCYIFAYGVGLLEGFNCSSENILQIVTYVYSYLPIRMIAHLRGGGAEATSLILVSLQRSQLAVVGLLLTAIFLSGAVSTR